MRSDETLCESTNRYFENRNTLAGVKDDDVIAYYKKEITNIKLFEKIHEVDAKTIGDLMAYVDKLVDTQDAVMHDFNGEDHNDRGTRSSKRSGEAYVADPPRPSTFLDGDFNMVMDDQCQFHRDAKHTMRECEQLKRALGVLSTSKKTRTIATTTATVVNASTIVTVDLIDEITVTTGPILAMMIGIDVIITATTAAMTDATTTVVMTTTIGVTTTEVIVTTIAMMIVTTTDMMIDVARTTTIARTTTGRSESLRHHPKGQPQWCVPEGQPRDQLHRRGSPSDQKQPTDSIKRQGDRARQH
jgi:voltage-gated potassium channel Kch